MALPKYKLSRSRTRRRKAVWKGGHKMLTLTQCPNCSKRVPAHTGCPACGHYKGKMFKAVRTEA